MNWFLLLANLLTLLAFFAHAIFGDRELHLIAPDTTQDPDHLKREKWTMARSGWHWISVDLALASLGLGLVNFTSIVPHERFLLQLFALYFGCYGLVWLLTIAWSPSFPKNYVKLGQWLLLWGISGLIYVGMP